MIVNRVERQILNKEHVLFSYLDDLSFKTKNLYNYANYLIRQTFITLSKYELTEENIEYLKWLDAEIVNYNMYKENNKEKSKARNQLKSKEKRKTISDFKPLLVCSKGRKYINYNLLQYLVKDKDCYKELPAQVAQQVLRVLDKNWQGFFKAIKEWKVNPQKFKAMPRLPRYKDRDGRFNIYFTNQLCSIKENFIHFPFTGLTLRTTVKSNLKQVRIKPLGSKYLLEVVYEKAIEEVTIENKQIASIDIGLNNFVTMTNNIGITPIVINGRGIKSINQYYNKQISNYKSILKKDNDKYWSNKLQQLTNKRNNRIEDFIHKASKLVVDKCKELKLDTIVIGKNEGWKQECTLGTITNQNFVQIPFSKFIDKLKYKCEDYQIKLLITEESYTSGTSFIDNELPIKENYNKKRRIKRGLFKSNKGVLINADCNGSYQIMKKVFPNVFADGIEGEGLHPIRVNIVVA